MVDPDSDPDLQEALDDERREERDRLMSRLVNQGLVTDGFSHLSFNALRSLARLLLEKEWIVNEKARRFAMATFLAIINPTKYQDGLGRKKTKVVERLFMEELNAKNKTLAQELLAAKSRTA